MRHVSQHYEPRNVLFNLFYAIVGLLALWLVVGGLMSFRTRQITLYLGNKPFAFEGGKAIIAGIFSAIVGMAFLAYAIYVLYGRFTVANAG
jgi:hypothetical protein